MNDCPNCEYHRKRAQLWRDEAYKQAGHPLPDRELVCVCGAVWEGQELVVAPPQPEQDYKDLYEKEKRKSAMWLSKYEEVAGPAPKAIPMAQPEQEPVACKECHLKDLVYDLLGELKVANLKLSVRAKRTWVGLTDEEIDDLSRTMVKGNKSANWLCQAIEAKQKEKNDSTI